MFNEMFKGGNWLDYYIYGVGLVYLVKKIFSFNTISVGLLGGFVAMGLYLWYR